MKKFILISLIICMISGCSFATSTHVIEKDFSKEQIIEVDYTHLQEKIQNKDSFVLYIGRPDCRDCQEFEPYLKKYLNDNKGVYLYYFNIKEYLLERIENPEFFCEKFRSFMSMIYSGEVPLSYLSNMKNAVEGMLDTFLSEHRMSMFIDDRNMAKTVVYIQKAMEKADLLYRRNYGKS